MSPQNLNFITYSESNVILIFHKSVCLWGYSGYDRVIVGFNLQLPVESMPITTSAVRSNPVFNTTLCDKVCQ